MNNKYEKQDNHKTDKWGNIIPKEPFDKNKNPPINNPFAEFFKDVKFKDIKK